MKVIKEIISSFAMEAIDLIEISLDHLLGGDAKPHYDRGFDPTLDIDQSPEDETSLEETETGE